MKKLYKLHIDCGRMGNIEGLFIAEENEVQNIIGKTVWFGEILGKHSDISVKLEESSIREITNDWNYIQWMLEVFGPTISGYNPLEYYTE